MEEVDGTILDGDTIVVSGVTLFIDVPNAPEGPPEAPGWHAHAELSLSVVLRPDQKVTIRTADGRTAPALVAGPPVVEGGEALWVFTGTGPFTAPSE